MKDAEKARVFETSDTDPRMTEDDTSTDDTQRYAYRWESKYGKEELLITDGSPQFWRDYGEIVSIITWDGRDERSDT